MCYKSPGPRCSGHMLIKLNEAILCYEANPSDTALRWIRWATEDFLRTPAGIKRLREEGGLLKTLLAAKYERERKAKIAQAKKAANSTQESENIEIVSMQRDAQGRLHSADGQPSLVLSNGMTMWHANGELHREGEPAVINTNHNGTGSTVEVWYKEGKEHREGGPAWENLDAGNKYYYREGVVHREDGPAVIYGDGKGGTYEESYIVNGKSHREDGPAVIRYEPDGTRTEKYFVNDRLHREDGPAEVVQGGRSESYYINGKRHREDGPAHVKRDANGTVVVEEYYQDGVPHREDGPALINRRTGEAQWARKGQPVSPPGY